MLLAETLRIQAHFAAVLGELRARDTRGLTPAARATRATLVDALAGYADAGRFPRNLDFPEAPTPYFVDAAGVRCAVGHLMHVSGEDALVADIAANDNHARVAELAADARLGAWLTRVGLDVAEAARIQPTYCFYTAVSCVCSVASPNYVAGNVESRDDSYIATVRVTKVYGDPAHAVGDLLTVSSPVAGGPVLVPFAEDGTAIRALPVHGNRVEVRCGDGAPDLVTADVMAAWDAADCAATFRARDPQADRNTCAYEEAQDEEGGCAGGPASSLLGLMGSAALWLRRFERRR